MDRRGFMQAILAACAAPAIVRIGSLTPMAAPKLITAAPIISVENRIEESWICGPSKSDPLAQRAIARASWIVNGAIKQTCDVYASSNSDPAIMMAVARRNLFEQMSGVKTK